MAVEDPGTLTVTCDDCGEQHDFDTSEYAGSPESWGIDDSTLEQEGWVRDGDETFCRECVAKREGEE